MNSQQQKKSFFNKDYVSYWQNRVHSSEDGSKVADEEIISFFVNQLEIKKRDVILDLGCGYGRLFNLLNKYTKKIIGLDVTYETLNAATKYPYLCLVKSSAEETNFPSCYFDKVIAWAVYDVVEQEKALIEQNRILKNGGLLLITGKNYRYDPHDEKAFIAERNAKLKGFPNHFTNTDKLKNNIENFGFDLIKGYISPKRCDLSENTFFELHKYKKSYFYSFLLILKKKCAPKDPPKWICHEYSETALQLAKENNFKEVKKYFEWHKDRYGN